MRNIDESLEKIHDCMEDMIPSHPKPPEEIEQKWMSHCIYCMRLQEGGGICPDCDAMMERYRVKNDDLFR